MKIKVFSNSFWYYVFVNKKLEERFHIPFKLPDILNFLEEKKIVNREEKERIIKIYAEKNDWDTTDYYHAPYAEEFMEVIDENSQIIQREFDIDFFTLTDDDDDFTEIEHFNDVKRYLTEVYEYREEEKEEIDSYIK